MKKILHKKSLYCMKVNLDKSNNFLPNFFLLLEFYKVKYLVLRNFKSLPNSTNGSDLDILIHKDSINIFNNMLNQFITNNNLKLVSFINDKHCQKYCIIGKNWGIQIDAFQESIFYKDQEIISSNLLFHNIEIYNNIHVLNAKVSSLLSFLKELLNNKFCNEKFILNLQKHYKDNFIESHFLSNFNPKFSFFLNSNLKKIDKKICFELYKLNATSINDILFYNFRNKLFRFLKQPGFTIAFIGTDGAGKSTIISKITPILNQAFHKSTYYEHMRPNKLPSIAKLFGKKEEFNKPVTNPHASSSSGLLGSLLRWLYYTIDYTIGFFLKVWPKKAIRSWVWVFDRYYYDRGYVYDCHDRTEDDTNMNRKYGNTHRI